MIKSILPYVCCFALLGFAATASAQGSLYTFTIQQVGTNVVASGSGNVNVSGLNLIANVPGDVAIMNPGQVLLETGTNITCDIYNTITGTSMGAFGTYTNQVPDAANGSFVGFYGLAEFLSPLVMFPAQPLQTARQSGIIRL